MIAAAPFVVSLAATRVVFAIDDSAPVSQLVDIINNDGSSIPQREEAALILVSRGTIESRNAVIGVLSNGANPSGQTAVARVVGRVSNPDSAFIDPISDLLGKSSTLTEVAAEALANCDGNAEVSVVLRRFIDNSTNSTSDRVNAIHAMSSVVQKDTADYLINQLSGLPNQNPGIIKAATEALTDMTGIATYGNNIVGWQQWWNSVRGKTPEQFRSIVLATRDQQFKFFKQHAAKVQAAMRTDLETNFSNLVSIKPDLAESTLLGYLKDPSPEIRLVGVDIISGFFDNPVTSQQPVRTQLLDMIKDPDDGVRQAVVICLLTVNDSAALQGLVDQIQVEHNPRIRAEIARVLGKLDDPAAIPVLLNLLNDPQPEIVAAGARALSGNLGLKLRSTNAAAADKASDQIRKKIEGPPAPPDDLRAALMAALASLRAEASFDTFGRYAQRGETPEVRRAALAGLGNLGDTKGNAYVAGQLEDNDRTVRYQAAIAMQTVATPDQADQLFGRMRDDPDPAVKDALWAAFQNLYPKENVDALNHWAAQFSNDPDKRLVTLQKLGDALAAAKDDQGVAANQQVIAEAMMELKPPRIADAIDNLKKALAYWRGTGKENSDKLEAIIGLLMDDELLAGRWAEATSIAADQIKFNVVYQETVGPRIKNKADELSTTDPVAAQALIDAALKMSPPLDQKYLSDIQQIQNNMKQKPPP